MEARSALVLGNSNPAAENLGTAKHLETDWLGLHPPCTQLLRTAVTQINLRLSPYQNPPSCPSRAG